LLLGMLLNKEGMVRKYG